MNERNQYADERNDLILDSDELEALQDLVARHAEGIPVGLPSELEVIACYKLTGITPAMFTYGEVCGNEVKACAIGVVGSFLGVDYDGNVCSVEKISEMFDDRNRVKMYERGFDQGMTKYCMPTDPYDPSYMLGFAVGAAVKGFKGGGES